MHVLSFPIQYIKLRRAHKKQIRNALHMLAVSGVVRPSHVELRYATPMASMLAYGTQSRAIEHQQAHPVPLPSWDHDSARTMKQTQRWTHGISSAFAQFTKKPILLWWAKQVDL